MTRMRVFAALIAAVAGVALSLPAASPGAPTSHAKTTSHAKKKKHCVKYKKVKGKRKCVKYSK